eukprot:Opistho-1_new@103211
MIQREHLGVKTVRERDRELSFHLRRKQPPESRDAFGDRVELDHAGAVEHHKIRAKIDGDVVDFPHDHVELGGDGLGARRGLVRRAHNRRSHRTEPRVQCAAARHDARAENALKILSVRLALAICGVVVDEAERAYGLAKVPRRRRKREVVREHRDATHHGILEHVERVAQNSLLRPRPPRVGVLNALLELHEKVRKRHNVELVLRVALSGNLRCDEHSVKIAHAVTEAKLLKKHKQRLRGPEIHPLLSRAAFALEACLEERVIVSEAALHEHAVEVVVVRVLGVLRGLRDALGVRVRPLHTSKTSAAGPCPSNPPS